MQMQPPNLGNSVLMSFRHFCHSIFALSLTRFAFRNPNGITYGYATFDLLLQNLSITKRSLTRFAFLNPNGITYGYATFDLLLQNLSITKRCFVIPTERSDEESIKGYIRSFTSVQE